MNKLISKTDYLVWRDCPHNAWMKKWKPDIYYDAPLSDFDKSLIETGNQVENKARELDLFSNGILIEGRDEQAINKTKELLQAKTKTLFQACFSDGSLFAAVDVLKQGSDGEIYLYEVKASNASKLEEGNDDEEEGDTVIDFTDIKAVAKYEKELLKDPHLYDIAFQVCLARKAGYKVGVAFLVRLDKGYVRGESLNIDKLFVIEDVLKYVDEIMPIVESEIEKMIKDLNSVKELTGPCHCIERGRSRHCTTFKENNKNILTKEELEYSVHDLTRIGNSKKKLLELIDLRVYDIMKIPDGMEFSKKIQKQINVHKSGKKIDYETIAEELNTLQFPLYFVDYESFNPAIPRFKGYKPYQHIPFQYSLDRLDSIDADLVHDEFFYAGQEDPAPLFIADLKKKIGSVGSIIVWNRTFEESHINKHIAIRLTDYKEFIPNTPMLRIGPLMYGFLI